MAASRDSSLKARLEPILPDIARGVRAAFATLVPFYLARRFSIHELAWTALGGWLGTLADPGGLRLSRARVLATFAISGAIVVNLSERALVSTGAAVVTLGAVAFGTSVLRVVGAAASSVGTLLLVIAAIALGGLALDPNRDALAFFGGALWALVFSSIVWPVWTHLPLRRPLSACWNEVGAYVAALDQAVDLKDGDPEWSALARIHQAKLRACIEETRAIALESRSRRSGESVLGSNLRTLLALAERLLPLLVAATENLEVLPLEQRKADWAPASKALTEAAVEVAAILQAPTLRRQGEPAFQVDRDETHGAFRRLVDAGVMAVGIARNLSTRPEQGAPELGGAAPASRVIADQLRMLRDAISLRSPYVQHAARVAIAVMLAQLVGLFTSPQHLSWVTITAIVVLQPYAGATVKRAAERVVGTVLGSLVAVAIMMTLRSPIALSLVMVPLSVASIATKPRSYRLFTLFLTPVFVLLAGRFDGDWWTAAVRSADALIGGAIALVAALVFPAREDAQLGDALERMISTLRRYADVAIDAHVSSKSASPEVTAARREVGIALGEAETSLERLLAEPLRSKDDAEAALLLVTHGRRLAGAITAMDQRHATPKDEEEAALAYKVRSRIDRVLTDGPVVDPSPQQASRPDLARIVRQADLLASARVHPKAPGSSRVLQD